MRIEFDASKFKDAFALAASASPARTPNPVLQNVLLTVADGVATLLGTDLETSVSATLAAEGGPMAALLPVDRVSAVLRTWAEPTLPIEAGDDGRLAIGTGRSKFKFQAEDPSGFPDPTAVEPTSRFELATDRLDDAFRKTAFATDQESARYALGGVAIEADGSESLNFVATDGRRLAWFAAEASWTSGGLDGGVAVVPLKAVRAASKAARAFGPVTSVAWNVAAVEFAGRDVTIRSRLTEGRFPRWRDVVPVDPAEPATMEAGALAMATAQAAVATSDESRAVGFTLSSGTLSLSAEAADVGSAAVEIDVATPDGWKAVRADVDPRYLLDAVRTLADDATVALRIKSAGEVVSLTADGGRYRYFVMPLSRGA